MHVLSVPTTCRYKHCSWRPYHCFAGYQREADNCKYTVLANFEIFLIVFLLAFQWARLQKILIFSIFFFKSRKKRVYIYYIYKPVFKNAPNLKISIRYIYTFFSHQEENFLTRKQNKKQTNKKKEKKYIYIYMGSLCFDFSFVQCSIHRGRARYTLR